MTQHNASGSRREVLDEALARATAALVKPGSLFAGPAINDRGAASKNIMINRHPIVDRLVNVHAYEPGSYMRIARDARNVFVAVCGNFDNIAGNSAVLMNLPCDIIPERTYQALPKERVILRVQDGRSNDETCKVMAKLYTEGYQLAASGANEDLQSVAGLVSIMNLDFRQIGRQGLSKRVGELRRFKAKLLVDNIDTYDEFEFCKTLGVDLFRGRFFLTPNSASRNMSSSRMAVVRLMAALQEPDIRLRDLENIIGSDVSLSYKLLRFANSAYVGLRREVDSVSHAVGLVGMERIQNWASLLLFSTIESKPRELFATAAIRAKMCEHLADSEDGRRKAMFFTAGLLSVLDAVLDRPMAEAVAELPLSGELHDALVDRTGTLGRTLQAVVAYEQSDWHGTDLPLVHKAALSDHYLESLGWLRTISTGLVV